MCASVLLVGVSCFFALSCTTPRYIDNNSRQSVDSLSAEMFNKLFRNGAVWRMDESYYVYDNDSLDTIDNTEFEGGQQGIVLLWYNDSLYSCYVIEKYAPLLDNTDLFHKKRRTKDEYLFDSGSYTYDETTHVLTIHDIMFKSDWKHIHEFTIISVSDDEIRCYSEYWPTHYRFKGKRPVKSLNIFKSDGERAAKGWVSHMKAP